MKCESKAICQFRQQVYDYFEKSGRSHLPWRKTRDPYRILVSEIMLQQTQVDRVIEKYDAFIETFPDFESLHKASIAQVYALWQGLGYNRRALALKKIAEVVINEHCGKLPDTIEELSKLPGIGYATASSIGAFAFNKPTIFIETNIRTAFIYHFFPRRVSVDDAEILSLAEKALDSKAPWKWYSALMDYGTMLKKEHPRITQKSSRYKKQSPFKGSRRQLRGKILRILLEIPGQTESSIVKSAGADKDATSAVIIQLVQEGFVKKVTGKFSIVQ